MKRSARLLLVFMIVLTMICSSVVLPYAETETNAGEDTEAVSDAEFLAGVGTRGIPVVYVNVDESETTIEQMNSDEYHKTKCTGTVDIKVPEDCTDVFGQASYGDMEGLVLKYIRGRGNSTWAEDKKPYKLEFKTEQSFFGMGSDKEWALMANYKDDTLFRNIMTAWVGDQLGFAYSPTGVPVELVMTGEKYGTHYLGCYVLSELVNRGENRVNIEKLGKNVSATEEEAAAGEANISGGYLISIFNENQDWDEPVNNIFKTSSGVELLHQYPEYESTDLTEGQTSQLEYIHNYMQKLEDLITAKTIDHDAVAEMMDLQSAVDYWMIQEFTKNSDAFQTHSTYMFKPRGDKLYWGPLWDFDFGWDLDTEYSVERGINYSQMLWIDHLRAKDPEFRAIVQQRWEVLKGILQELIANGGIMDQYEEGLSKAWEINRKLWPYLDDEDCEISYKERVDNLKYNIQKRIDVVDECMKTEISKVFVTVRFVADGKEVAVYDDVRINGEIEKIPEAPEKEGYVFENWYEEKSGDSPDNVTVDGDLTIVAKYVPVSEAVIPEKLFMRGYEDWAAVQDYAYSLPYVKVFPENTTDSRVWFTVSDESIATIKGDELLLHSTGDVVIKASTYNGIYKELTLHVYDKTQTEKQPVTEIKPAATSYKLAKGEVTQILFDLYPKDVPLAYQYIDYVSSNEKIAEIDYMGVVVPKKAGTVTIRYSVMDYNDNVEASGSLKVTVLKSANPLKVKTKADLLKVKYSKLRKKNQAIKRSKAITVSKAKGTVRYRLLSVSKKRYSKYFNVNKKTGRITIKKGLRKGTYKLRIKVRAAGNSQYKAATGIVTVKIRVK